jgi:putative transposase
MPANTPQAEYDPGEIVRNVLATKDYVSFKGRLWKVPMAFRGERVAIRPKNQDGLFGVFFASHHIAEIDLTAPQTVRHLSKQP